jgi:hypothetical protein
MISTASLVEATVPTATDMASLTPGSPQLVPEQHSSTVEQTPFDPQVGEEVEEGVEDEEVVQTPERALYVRQILTQ